MRFLKWLLRAVLLVPFFIGATLALVGKFIMAGSDRIWGLIE